ncbi:MAG TPA: hypothetical protein VGN81_04545 [Pseudonocardiaceae bacterium]
MRTTGVPRRRGALNGLLLILLGAWGGLVPFLGPRIGLNYTADAAWTFTWAKFWLEVLPGAAVLIGGLGLIGTAARAGGVLWGWLSALGGAWFIAGLTVSQLWTGGKGEFAAPAASTVAGRTIEEIVFFYGLGAVIVFVAGAAIGRFTVPARQDAQTVTDEPVEPAEPVERTEPVEPRTTTIDPSSAEQTTTMAKQPTAEQPTAKQPMRKQFLRKQPLAKHSTDTES